MPDLKKYWKTVRDTEAQIDKPFVFITSLDDPSRGWYGGTVTEVSRANAARLIVDGSHRISTDEEISKFYADQEAARQRIQERELRHQANQLFHRLVGTQKPVDSRAKK